MLIKSPLLTNHIRSKYTLKIVLQSTLTPTSARSEYEKKKFQKSLMRDFCQMSLETLVPRVDTSWSNVSHSLTKKISFE